MLTLLGLFFGAILFCLVGGFIWLVLLPLRILFKLIFGLVGGLIGLLVAPIIMLVVGVALVGAFFAAALALLTPLIPLALLFLLGWGLYRLFVRPSPAI